LNTVLESKRQNTVEFESNDASIGSFNPVYLDLQGSSNINYALTQNWTLSLSGVYSQSLNSIKNTMPLILLEVSLKRDQWYWG